MKLIKNIWWFTFVELMITLVILVSLSTIWVLAYISHVSDARNTERISNLNNVYDLFQLFKSTNQLPLPDPKTQISFSGELVAYQWYLTWGLLELIWWKDYLWKDPRYQDYYSYYITHNLKYFQFMWYVEYDSYKLMPIDQTYAKIDSYKKAIVVWDPVWIITDKLTNVPFQDLYPWMSVDLRTLTWSYILNVNDTVRLLWDNITLWTQLKNMALTGQY